MALAPDLERHRGKWVAFEERTQKVLASAESEEALYEVLDRGSFPRVTIRRVPRLDEPIFVGLG